MFPEIVALPEIDGAESRSLAKGLQLLETLAVSGTPMSLSDLAGSIGLGKASTLRLIRTLVSLRMIQRIDGDRYRLLFAWPSRSKLPTADEIRGAADGPMRQLNAELGETVALACLYRDHIRIAAVVESSHHIRMSNYRDRILQPYASSLGKAIAAFQERELAQRLLDVYGIYSLTPNTITELAAIREEFDRVRRLGYAEDREETVVDGLCIGAPIAASLGGPVVAALSVSTPKVRFTERYAEQLPGLVIGAARRITDLLINS